jgi:hypothetical protein
MFTWRPATFCLLGLYSYVNSLAELMHADLVLTCPFPPRSKQRSIRSVNVSHVERDRLQVAESTRPLRMNNPDRSVLSKSHTDNIASLESYSIVKTQ